MRLGLARLFLLPLGICPLGCEEAAAPVADWLRGEAPAAARPARRPPRPPSPRELAPIAPVEATPHRFEPPSRVVAIGDLHGDLAAAERALQLAGALGRDGRWIGEDLVVVQMGNRRGPGGRGQDVEALFERLQAGAQAAGGRVIRLMGSREAEALGEPASTGVNELPVAVVVGNTAFVHAGLSPRHAERGLEALNRREVAASGEEGASSLLRDPRGPLSIPDYTYAYVPKPTCKRLVEVLRALEVDRLVVAHAFQKWGVSAACDQRLYRIDVGLSRSRGGRMEVLEITPGRARALRADE